MLLTTFQKHYSRVQVHSLLGTGSFIFYCLHSLIAELLSTSDVAGHPPARNEGARLVKRVRVAAEQSIPGAGVSVSQPRTGSSPSAQRTLRPLAPRCRDSTLLRPYQCGTTLPSSLASPEVLGQITMSFPTPAPFLLPKTWQDSQEYLVTGTYSMWVLAFWINFTTFWESRSGICLWIYVCEHQKNKGVCLRELNLKFERETLRAVGNLLISADWQNPSLIGN